ncbi:MAG: hypothetical protein GY755_23870 [Chloroflexi bacterium]|nr:hypothetical protein [Chloroflexota bacterium]
MKPTIHRHGTFAKISRFLAPLPILSAVCLSVYYLTLGIFSLEYISRYGYLPLLQFTINIIYYGLVAYWSFSAYLLFADIETDDEGLHIRIFFKSRTIKWSEIKEVKSVILFGLFERPSKKIVLTTSKLPVIFRIIGLLQGKTFSPSLRINSSISDYSVLRKRVSKAARQNQRLEKKKQANK